jgi:hypothetical protein
MRPDGTFVDVIDGATPGNQMADKLTQLINERSTREQANEPHIDDIVVVPYEKRSRRGSGDCTVVMTAQPPNIGAFIP